MKFGRQWIPNYTDLDDEELLKQIEIIKKNLKIPKDG